MLLTFDVFCCCREKGYQSTFSFSFLFFQENGASLENKAVISASSSPLPLNSIVLPISLFRLKKIPLQIFDQEKHSSRNQGRVSPWMMWENWTGIRDWLDHGWGLREERWMVSFRGCKPASTQGSWKKQKYTQEWLLSKYWDSEDLGGVFWSQVMCGWGYVLAAWSISI